jgi:hypothetical protein
VVTPGDIQYTKAGIERTAPGGGTDPFTEDGFTQLERFGTGPNQVVIFKFDFREPTVQSNSASDGETLIRGSWRSARSAT